MANSVNKVILVGRLGKDPEVRVTGGGQSVASFSIATNERWTGKNGEPEERTEWHNIVAWGRLAELCRDYLNKGAQVYIEGRLQTREYEDKDKIKRRTTEINAREVVFLSSKGAGGSRGDEGGYDAGGYGGGGGGSRRSVGPAEPVVADDDIPF
jgi:single-strand DNA-binding protein